MTREFEIRLVGHPSRDGTLLASDALALIKAFKELTYRLTRAVADRTGLGRTDAALERLGTVRVGLAATSARLIFVVGDEAALDLEDPISSGVDEAYWDLVQGIQRNARPAMASDPVADAVDQLVVALGKAAQGAEIAVPGHGRVEVRTSLLSRDPWRRRMPGGIGESGIHGVLEMVDLRTARFRLRDAAQNGIDLIDVRNAEAAAHLVGEPVTATGVLALGRGTGHHRMEQAVIAEQLELGQRSGAPSAPSLIDVAQAAARRPAPPPMELGPDELDDFLAALDG